MMKVISASLATIVVTILTLYSFGLISPIASKDELAHTITTSDALTDADLSPMGKELDNMFRLAWPPDQPGGSVIVAKGGEVILKKGYGLADIEHQVSNTSATVFRIASLTKQFTAVAILLLEQDGLLKVEDSITDYLTGYSTHGEIITIEHLLTHTSGIMNFTDDPKLYEANKRKALSTEEILSLFSDRDLDFKPGTSWYYSDSGYIVLGAIIEKVSGMSYPDFVKERIFKPLGMKSSYYGSDQGVVLNRARGYTLDGDGYINVPYISMTIPFSADSLLSTVEDLNIWNTSLLSGALLPRAMLERAWTTGVLVDGSETDYGYGWATGSYEGASLVWHSGGIEGFGAYSVSIPGEDIYVAVLSNNEGIPQTWPLAQRSASLAMAKPVGSAEAVVSMSETDLQKYVGDYQAGPSSIRNLSLEDGVLVSQRDNGPKSPIQFTSESEFFFEGTTTTGWFKTSEDGIVVAMFAIPWSMKAQRAPKL